MQESGQKNTFSVMLAVFLFRKWVLRLSELETHFCIKKAPAKADEGPTKAQALRRRAVLRSSRCISVGWSRKQFLTNFQVTKA